MSVANARIFSSQSGSGSPRKSGTASA
jgi:hypothetical protein